MQPSRHEAVARRFFEALGTNDLDALIDVMHPDLVWEVPGTSPTAGCHVGLVAVGAMMVRISEMAAGTETITVRELFVSDLGVVALIDVSLQPPGDEPWHGDDAWLVRTDGTRVTHVREHWFDTRGFDELEAWSTPT
jgi:ketosteroid isomerase-like protein